MTGKDLLEAMNYLPEELVEAGEKKMTRKNLAWRPMLVMAACLCLAVMGVARLSMTGSQSKETLAAPTAASASVEMPAMEAAEAEMDETGACAEDAREETPIPVEPPVLLLQSGENRMEIYSGNYRWARELGDGMMEETAACGTAPSSPGSHYECLRVNEPVRLVFELQPDEVHVSRTDNGIYLDEMPTEDGEWVPAEGRWLYVVKAEWNRELFRGTAEYTFEIER